VYAVGHLALGYITGKTVSKATKTSINLPLIFALSILPDIDLVFLRNMHRGPTHSIILLVLLSLPFLAIFKRRMLPYLASIASHVLIGDMINGPVKIFWPLTQQWYGLPLASGTPIVVSLEWAFFLISLMMIFMSRDFRKMLKLGHSGLLLALPLVSVGVPVVLGYYSSPSLFLPQLFYAVYFISSMILCLVNMIVPRGTHVGVEKKTGID
jgi:membrane-bound metal-dependent hydrolase YbcI (DUF457 family)